MDGFVDIPLLPYGDNVVHYPIQYQTGREEEEEHAEYHWHPRHDFSLDWISRLRVKLGLYDHGQAHDNRQYIVGVHCRKILYPAKEGRVA